MPSTTWSWDEATQRFFNEEDGTYLPTPRHVDLRDQMADESADLAREIGRAAAAGEMTPDMFRNSMKGMIKSSYGANYSFGRGGLGNVGNAELEAIGREVARQEEFLDGFYEDIKNGRYKNSPDTAAARAAMYSSGAVQAYERGYAAAYGVQLPGYPGDGGTVCRSNCRCSWYLEQTPEGVIEASWVLGGADPCLDCRQRAHDWDLIRFYGEGLLPDYSPQQPFTPPSDSGIVTRSDLEDQVDLSELESATANWRLKAKQQDIDDILEYTGTAHMEVNYYHRNYEDLYMDGYGDYSKKDIKRLTKSLDKSIARSELPGQTKVYRGSSEDDFPYDLDNLPPGSRISDEGFLSTTLSRKQGTNYAIQAGDEGVLFEIDLPKGHKGLFLDGDLSRHPYEKELLLPRGSEFEVIDIRKEGNLRVVNLKVPGAHYDEIPVKTRIHTPKDDYDLWAKEATEEQHTAIMGYIEDSESFNWPLRHGDTSGMDAFDLRGIETLDEALDRAIITQPITVYRGVHLNPGTKFESQILGLDDGDVFVDDGFMSTAMRRKTADDFVDEYYGPEGKVIFEIDVPPGTKGLNITDEDIGGGIAGGEILLPRNTKLQIVGKPKLNADGSMTVKAKVVDQPKPKSLGAKKSSNVIVETPKPLKKFDPSDPTPFLDSKKDINDWMEGKGVFLVDKIDDYNLDTLKKAAKQIAKIPQNVMDMVVDTGGSLQLVPGKGITAHPAFKNLKGVTPQKYKNVGSTLTWDDIGGAAQEGLAVVALDAQHSGSVNVFAHELAHVIDNGNDISSSPEWMDIWKTTKWPTKYETNSPDEAFAESFARYYESDFDRAILPTAVKGFISSLGF